MEIRGVIKEILQRNEENDWMLFSAYYMSDSQLVEGRFTGSSGNLEVGSSFKTTGDWKNYTNRKGEQSQTFNCKPKSLYASFPEDTSLLIIYLGLMFSSFNNSKYSINTGKITEAILNNPSFLNDLIQDPNETISLLTSDTNTINEMVKRWEEKSKIPYLEHDLFHNLKGSAVKEIPMIVDSLNSRVNVNELLKNPYCLIKLGLTFEQIDVYAQAKKIYETDKRRVNEACSLVFEEVQKTSSTTITIFDYIEMIFSFLGKPKEESNQKIIVDEIKDYISKAGGNFYIRDLKNNKKDVKILCDNSIDKKEEYIANVLISMLNENTRDPKEYTHLFENAFKKEKYKKFDSIQKLAVGMSIIENVCVVTGGPGTGKSTVTEAIAELCEDIGENLYLVSPTGKAAKRLKDTTKKKTSTVHSLLKARGKDGVFLLNENNTLKDHSVIIIDEASMLDVDLMYALLKAMPKNARLIFIGDKNQLPSIGPGALLSDMLTASTFSIEKGKRIEIIPSVELQKVYRQEKDSGIAFGAKKIKDGIMPDMNEIETSGVQFVKSSSEHVGENVINVFNDFLNRGLSKEDIVVACAEHNKSSGTLELNYRLSHYLNKEGEKISGYQRIQGKSYIRIGDRVMLTENDNAKGVMNGDMGYVKKQFKDKGKNMVQIEFDSKDDHGNQITLDYFVNDLYKFTLGYACTIHKLQGSQAKTIIMPIVKEQGLLYRNLIYTGWTRAEKNIVVIGDKSAFKRGVETVRDFERQTMLRFFLEDCSFDNLFKNRNKINWRALEKTRCKEMKIPYTHEVSESWINKITKRIKNNLSSSSSSIRKIQKETKPQEDEEMIKNIEMIDVSNLPIQELSKVKLDTVKLKKSKFIFDEKKENVISNKKTTFSFETKKTNSKFSF